MTTNKNNTTKQTKPKETRKNTHKANTTIHKQIIKTNKTSIYTIMQNTNEKHRRTKTTQINKKNTKQNNNTTVNKKTKTQTRNITKATHIDNKQK